MLSALLMVVSTKSTKSASGVTQPIAPALIGNLATPPADESGVLAMAIAAIAHVVAKTARRRQLERWRRLSGPILREGRMVKALSNVMCVRYSPT
jgi:hypothetical protein